MPLLVKPALGRVVASLQHNVVALQPAGEVVPSRRDHGVLALEVLDHNILLRLQNTSASALHAHSPSRRAAEARNGTKLADNPQHVPVKQRNRRREETPHSKAIRAEATIRLARTPSRPGDKPGPAAKRQNRLYVPSFRLRHRPLGEPSWSSRARGAAVLIVHIAVGRMRQPSSRTAAN